MSMSNQIQLVAFFFAGNLVPATADSASALVAPVHDSVEADAPPDGGLDGLTEAGYTLAAFLVAAAAIQAMKQRNRCKNAASASLQKSAKFGSKHAAPAARKSAFASQNRTGALLAARQSATPSAASSAPCERDGRRPAPQGGARQTLRSRDAEENDVLAAAVRVGRAFELPRLMDAARARAAANGADEASLSTSATPAAVVCAEGVRRAPLLPRGACRLRPLRRPHRRQLHQHVELAALLRRGGLGLREMRGVCRLSAPEWETMGNDFVNIVRFHVQLLDAARLREFLLRLRGTGFQLDSIARNRALSMCVSGKAPELAEVLADVEVSGVALDIIGYNTLMKCFAQAKQPDRCFHLYDDLRLLGLEPSDVTLGILLDACVDAGDHDQARQVFNDMRGSGFKLNAVHFTTFMKGLVSAGQLTEAMDVFEAMLASDETKPDLVTYSTLVKAHADHGNVTDAIHVLERMMKQGIAPDAVIFNIVLTGCCVKPMEAKQIFHVFQWLTNKGLRVSTSTLSILVKALAKSCAWDAALDMLEKAPERLQLWPEARLYGQLAQACVQCGDASKAVDAYALMVRAAARQGVGVDKASNARLLRLCSSCGGFRIFEAVSAAGGLMEPEAVDALLADLA
eukprot:CAMPEP_0117541734 /NCGR_PEP_ID=MMETSP0784-20121206/44170_1 /TAXON_ID=39447 /ORGANISM="" /LENGTH=628 /DNA_ID=CAMNT_0005338435 /DNA_START=64 /DNA_END=1951 /DNA_ORIENTATION=-